jgi:hypothetical protein
MSGTATINIAFSYYSADGKQPKLNSKSNKSLEKLHGNFSRGKLQRRKLFKSKQILISTEKRKQQRGKEFILIYIQKGNEKEEKHNKKKEIFRQ